MKHIKLLVLHLNYGGAEKQITTMANALCSTYEIEIISLYKIGESPFYKLDPRITVKYLLPYGPNKEAFIKALHGKNAWNLLKEGLRALNILYNKKRKMVKAMKGLEGDVIISSRIEFTEWLKRYGRKDLVTITQEHSYFESSAYIKRMQKAFVSTDALVVMSNTALTRHAEWLKDLNIEVVKISNMIDDMDSFVIPEYQNKTMLSVGRMHKVKRYDLMIRIFKKALITDSEWKLVLVGDGDELEVYKELVKELILENNVVFTGALVQQEVQDWYQNSSMFLLSSSSESFSLVLAEAQGAGLPTVSFDVEVGPRDIIVDGETGFLVEEGDIEQYISTVKKLMLDQELRSRLGQTAHEHAKKFQSSIIALEWINLIEKLTTNV